MMFDIMLYAGTLMTSLINKSADWQDLIIMKQINDNMTFNLKWHHKSADCHLVIVKTEGFYNHALWPLIQCMHLMGL